MTEKILHDSAVKHVTGEAVFVNDIVLNEEPLTGYVYYSTQAHARIKSYDINKALSLRGVHKILSYRDIPGENQMGPVVKDELCLAEDEVTFIGQAIFLIAAENRDIANEASKLINVEYEPLEAVLDFETAIEKNSLIAPQRVIERGDVEKSLSLCTHKISGELRTGAQEHWYLETQSALCIPQEGNEMLVYSSTQHPSETQAIIAEVLGITSNEVTVEVRRLGGAFGGKETQANHTAVWSALLASATGKPVKIHLFRDDDQKITGKRHRFLSRYEIGFNDNGIINAYKVELNSDAGAATDLSLAILERAMLHAENAYYIPNIRIIGKAYKTNNPSNTAMRGFGGPQAIAVIENAIDRIARFLNKDSSEIRKINFYQKDRNNICPYGEIVENNHLPDIFEKLFASSDYEARKKQIDEYNSKNEFVKKGIAITPVKFGISFTTSFLNQAGALVNIYKDGTVLVNHGGIEMGQGLNTKIQCIASKELGVGITRIKVNATNTSKIPNTSATAASSGSDLNGMAVKNAIDKLKARLSEVAVKIFNEKIKSKHSLKEDIVFNDDYVYDSRHNERKIKFKELISAAYLNQVSLSASGFYRTPDIYFDREKGQGKPFHYYSFSMAVSEVLVDILTGFVKLLRTDILLDAGDSINEGIDKGQITGGFLQGIGWCTTEEIKWDEKGNLLTYSPDTYKIPSVKDIPDDFRIDILRNVPNYNTVRRSKAIGEPPFMLALSAWLAVKYAVSAVAEHKYEPDFSLPATNEAIALSIEKLKNKK